MTAKDDGGSAFPQLDVVGDDRDGHGDAIESYTISKGGMSLRDYFAGQALVGIMTNVPGPGFTDWSYYSDAAYHVADAMLASRKAREAHS